MGVPSYPLPRLLVFHCHSCTLRKGCRVLRRCVQRLSCVLSFIILNVCAGTKFLAASGKFKHVWCLARPDSGPFPEVAPPEVRHICGESAAARATFTKVLMRLPEEYFLPLSTHLYLWYRINFFQVLNAFGCFL